MRACCRDPVSVDGDRDKGAALHGTYGFRRAMEMRLTA